MSATGVYELTRQLRYDQGLQLAAAVSGLVAQS